MPSVSLSNAIRVHHFESSASSPTSRRREFSAWGVSGSLSVYRWGCAAVKMGKRLLKGITTEGSEGISWWGAGHPEASLQRLEPVSSQNKP